VVIEQYSPGAHGSLQVEAPFPMTVELEVKNLPLPGTNS
jgi:hypothetical protein